MCLKAERRNRSQVVHVAEWDDARAATDVS